MTKTGSQAELKALPAGELFAIAIGTIELDDDPAAWDAIHELRKRGGRTILAMALASCAGADPAGRRVGAGILAQFGGKSGSDGPFHAERLACLIGLLDREVAERSGPDQLRGAIAALGHLKSPRSLPHLLPLRHHADRQVRFSVTLALEGIDDVEAIDALIALSGDEYDDVRDWATFALGSQTARDTPEIRDALRHRLDDSHADTRGEAMVGLARRSDESVIAHLIAAFDSGAFGTLHFEAAECLADARLLPSLEKAGEHSGDWTPREREGWQHALAACRPWIAFGEQGS